MTPEDISAAVTSVRTAFDICKGMAAVIKKVNETGVKADLNEKILDLQGRLISTQGAILALAQDNAELRRAVRDSADRSQLLAKFRFDGHVSWKEDNGGREGPYCSGCLEGRDKAVHLKCLGTPGTYTCPVCQTSVMTEEYKRGPHPPPGSKFR